MSQHISGMSTQTNKPTCKALHSDKANTRRWSQASAQGNKYHVNAGPSRVAVDVQRQAVDYLSVELDVGRAQADKAGEQGLVQVAVLLEGHVLDHRRQLVVVAD